MSSTGGAPSATMPAALGQVTARLQSIVGLVGKVIFPAVLAGLAATAVIALALVPWLFHSTGAKVVWALILLVGLAATLRLAWHRRLLLRTLGRPQFVVDTLVSLNQTGRVRIQELARELDNVKYADKGTRVGGALKTLANVRNLKAVKEISGSAIGFVAPISPRRLLITGYAAAVVVGAVVLALPVMFFSLLGLALR